MRPTTAKCTPRWRPSVPRRIGEASASSSACLPMSSILTPSRSSVLLQKGHTATIEAAPRNRTGAPHDGQFAVFIVVRDGRRLLRRPGRRSGELLQELRLLGAEFFVGEDALR